ncbi:MAG: hypothetical protein DMG11_29670 [Acidobacteria bacterium]|nr:MAG: hypothetical protein DMG11_29670 [Acidobacteriota bacterium]
MNPLRVLLIEDDEQIRTLLEDRLADAGYECKAATSGRAGLALLETGIFDAALLDIHLGAGSHQAARPRNRRCRDDRLSRSGHRSSGAPPWSVRLPHQTTRLDFFAALAQTHCRTPVLAGRSDVPPNAAGGDAARWRTHRIFGACKAGEGYDCEGCSHRYRSSDRR